jgi:hypothetical protein
MDGTSHLACSLELASLLSVRNCAVRVCFCALPLWLSQSHPAVAAADQALVLGAALVLVEAQRPHLQEPIR